MRETQQLRGSDGKFLYIGRNLQTLFYLFVVLLNLNAFIYGNEFYFEK